MPSIVIAAEDPRTPDIVALLDHHLAFAHQHTPSRHVHALGIDGLVDPAVTLFTARRSGELLGVGALRELDATHGEIKSMHTSEAARRSGVGRAIVDHLVSEARRRGYVRVSLETGTMDAFAPARSLYSSVGFEPCGPFGDYAASPTSAFMALDLEQPR